MTEAVRLAAARAMVRRLAVQPNEDGEPFLAGAFAIFGHGDVAGIGEALHAARGRCPIGRAPDPMLQQVEDWEGATVAANDAFRPVSRRFDRISRPEHLLTAAPRALRAMTDPADRGPVTPAFRRDGQAAFNRPEAFFAPRTWTRRRPHPDPRELAEAAATPRTFAEAHAIPVAETQAGKSALPWDHPLNLGGIGLNGASAANETAAAADLLVGVGARFQDFTTGSGALFRNPGRRILSINVAPCDAAKHGALSLVADARVALERRGGARRARRLPDLDPAVKARWTAADAVLAAPEPEANAPPTDMQLIGAAQRSVGEDAIVVRAAGGPPGEPRKLRRPSRPDGRISDTASPAWAARSRAARAPRWPAPPARSSFWSATAAA